MSEGAVSSDIRQEANSALIEVDKGTNIMPSIVQESCVPVCCQVCGAVQWGSNARPL